jgi:hypothetical protein
LTGPLWRTRGRTLPLIPNPAPLEHRIDARRYVRCGACGEDGAEWWHLARVAIDRARALGSPKFALSEVLVIADTPL